MKNKCFPLLCRKGRVVNNYINEAVIGETTIYCKNCGEVVYYWAYGYTEFEKFMLIDKCRGLYFRLVDFISFKREVKEEIPF